MKLLRLSPSTIGKWQSCKFGDYSQTLQDFNKYLTEKIEPKFAMAAGTCWHKLLETGGEIQTHFRDGIEYECAVQQADGWTVHFTGQALELARLIRKTYTGVQELRMTNRYQLPILDREVNSEMVIDLVQGLVLHEFKTKLVDAAPNEFTLEMATEQYENSIQWRMYLDAMPMAQKVIYTIAYLKKPEVPKGEELSKDNPVIISECFEPLQLEYEPYPTMKWDILQWMEGLVRYCQANDLEQYIVQKPKHDL